MTTQTGREPEAPEPSDVLDAEAYERMLQAITNGGNWNDVDIIRFHDAALRAELATAREDTAGLTRLLRTEEAMHEEVREHAGTQMARAEAESKAKSRIIATLEAERQRIIDEGLRNYDRERGARERAEAALTELQTEAEKEIREQAEILEEACHVANTGWERAEGEVERLRAALREIIAFEPERVYETPEESLWAQACPDCKRNRERQWPPSGRCEVHYRTIAAAEGATLRNRNRAYIDMRDIARAALAVVPLGEMEKPGVVVKFDDPKLGKGVVVMTADEWLALNAARAKPTDDNDRPDDAHAHGIRFVAEVYGTPTDDGVLFQQRFEGGLPGEGEPVFVFPFEVTSRTWRELGEPRVITVTFEVGVPDA